MNSLSYFILVACLFWLPHNLSMNEIVIYMRERLKERSTWVGLSAFAASMQYQFTDVMLDDFCSILIAFCGLAMVFTKDDTPQGPQHPEPQHPPIPSTLP